MMNPTDEVAFQAQLLEDYEIASRFNNRPGFNLVSCQKVGLPVYKLTLRVSTQLKKKISPIEEFVLKAIDIGLPSEVDISNFLGLGSGVIRDVMVSLRMEQHIDLVAPEGERQQVWRLTNRGKQVLSETKKIAPEERTYVVHFDRLLGEIKSYGTWESKLLVSKVLQKEGGIEISPSKSLEITDLSLEQLARAVKTTERTNRRKEERDYLAIRLIEQRKPLFLPTKALIYKSNNSDEVQVAFLVDNRIHDEYEEAFARSRNPKKLNIMQSLRESDPIRNLEVSFGPNLIDRESLRESEKLKSTFFTLSSQYSKIKEKVVEADENRSLIKKETDEEIALKQKLKELEEELKTLKKERESKSVALLEMWEHREFLETAIRNTQDRLLIISPWIAANAVNPWFLSNFEKLLKRGGLVHIGYGISKETSADKPQRDIQAEQVLLNFSKQYDNFTMERLGNTHSKILVSDNSFAIVTSFNWLSFLGDPKKPFRDERGTIHRDPEFIEEIYSKTLSQFAR